jgi:hypothetical protein
MEEAAVHATKPRFQNRFAAQFSPPFPHRYSFLFNFSFQPSLVTAIMEKIVKEKLDGQEYHPENTPSWSREISDEIRNQMRSFSSSFFVLILSHMLVLCVSLLALNFDRYKYCVQVFVGEQKGEGIRFGFKALWDKDTDDWAQYTYEGVCICLFCQI